MSNSLTSLLSRPGLDVVKDLFLASFIRPLDLKFLQFTLDASTSELVITSLDESQDGEVGIYRNNFRWPYVKANLSTLLPYAMALRIDYPLTFRQLRTQLLDRYQIYMDENEFSLSPDAVPLTDDSAVDSTLVSGYGQFNLYAAATSGRFVTNSQLKLMFIQPNRRVPLQALFDLRVPDILGEMATA
jgi:hypothetical protein